MSYSSVQQQLTDVYKNKEQLTPELVAQVAQEMSKIQGNLSDGQTQYKVIHLLAGGGNIGSQIMPFVNSVMEQVQNYQQQQLKSQQQQLQSINPAFDINKYYVPVAETYNWGDGATGNRERSAVSTWMQIQEQNKALQKAQQAAQKYQQTGQIDPYPDVKQELMKFYEGMDWSSISKSSKEAELNRLNNVVYNGVTEEDKKMANAAAARVGAPLPYKEAGIGEMRGGGYFTSPDEAMKYYQGGVFNQQSYDQQFSGGNTQSIKQQLDSGVNPQTGQPLTDSEKANLEQQLKTTTTQSAAPTSLQGTQQSNQNSIQSALDFINNSGLDEGTKMLYTQILQNWDPKSEVNVPNILDQFKKIKETTIDPYFKEQSRVAIDQIQSSYKNMSQQRGLALEQENAQAKENISGAQNSLEARGLTFSGEAVKQLGTDSAFVSPGGNVVEGGVPRFGGQEGLVQKQNRIISSSSQAAYMKGLQDLSRSAEQTLGTEAAKGLVPGVNMLGGIKESAQLPNQQKQSEASTLTNLYNQSVANVQQNQAINPFQN